jgi:hypothetical protein
MERSSKNLLALVLLLSIIFTYTNACIAQNSSAEKLTAVLPDDVVGFIATSGADELKPAFEKTILNQIWKDPGVQTFYKSIYKELTAKIELQVQDPNASKPLDTILGFVELVKNRPFIIGAAQKQTMQGPPIYAFAILDAGQRKAELAAALVKLERMAGEGDIVEVKIGSATLHGPKDAKGVPGYWGWIGNYLVFAINDGQGLAVKFLQDAPKDRPKPNYLQKVKSNNDALAVYIDIQKTINILATVTKAEGDEKEFAIVEAVFKEIGFDKVKTVSSRTGFNGPDLVIDELIEVPQPRTGLFACFNTIDMDMFKMVDARAMTASAVNCDMAGIYDTIIRAIKAAAGEDFAEIEEAIAEVEEELEFKIRDGLLESLNGQVLFYVLPGGIMPQSPQGGFIAVAKLKNEKLWRESLTALGKLAAEKSEGMVQVGSQEQNGRTINTWAIMPLAMAQVMPCWAIANDNVVIASNPMMCNLAIEQIESNKKSIRSVKGFKEVTSKLPDNLLGLKYSDSKVQFNQMMMGVQQFWPMLTMVAAKAKLQLPFMLPSLTHIAEKMGPSCQYSWFDDQGIRSHYRGVGIEQSIGVVAGGALGVGVMMPAMARTRQQAFRITSTSNLKGIGKALLIYANDFDDEFPPNLEVLVEKEDLDPGTLESKRKPKGFDGPSYIYIAGQNTSMHPGNIIVYENPGYCKDGLNVLYLDSHVQWMKPNEFLKDLKETYQRLGREMPEVKFKN